MTLTTKPKVRTQQYATLLDKQGTDTAIGRGPTWKENSVKSERFVPETDRQTDTLITVLRCPTER